MSQPTPDYAYVKSVLPFVAARLSVAIDEVLRLLTVYLPGAIDGFNGDFGTTLNKPKSVRIAPSELDDVDTDSILVDWRTDKVAFAGGMFSDVNTLMVHSIDKRFVQGRHVLNVIDRSVLVQAVLYVGLGGWYDPTPRQVWFSLAPTAVTGLPSEWGKYSGTTVHYKLDQTGINCWDS